MALTQNQTVLTVTQAQEWEAHKPVNPLTGRTLKEGSALSRKLDKLAARALGHTHVHTQSGCSATWVKLSQEEAYEYGASPVIICSCGRHSRFLHAVHNEHGVGDYGCVRCEQGVNLIYFCYFCKNACEVEG